MKTSASNEIETARETPSEQSAVVGTINRLWALAKHWEYLAKCSLGFDDVFKRLAPGVAFPTTVASRPSEFTR